MKNLLTYLSLFPLAVALGGCKPAEEKSLSDDASSPPIIMDDMPPMIESRTHPEQGPHGGEIVELGKEDFHVEIVHGSGAIVFYLLDGAVADPVAVEAAKLTVSLKHDDEVRSFEVAADPQPGDPAGKSSRFTSADPLFAQWMDAEAEGAVIAEIEGKSFTGKIAHDHDHNHAGHAHD